MLRISRTIVVLICALLFNGSVYAGTINCSWTDTSDNEDNFVVERCTGANCSNFSQLAIVSANSTSYTDTSAPVSTDLRYRVKAVNSAGSSPYSNVAASRLDPPGPAGGLVCQFNEAPDPSPSAGLVASYNFNLGSGSILPDLSGNGNNGTIYGATWSSVTQGKTGRALNFDGSNDLVSIPDSISLDLTSAMTLMAWVRPTVLGNVWRTILLKEMLGDSPYGLYATTGSGTPGGYVLFTPGSPQNATGSSPLPLATWSHLAMTWDGTTILLYLNGTQIGTKSASGTIPTTDRALGIGGNTIWSEWFQGRIDDIRIYNRALSPSEITTDMNTPIP